MYQNGGAPAAAGVLAYTGYNRFWLSLGAFALIAFGLAIIRMMPKEEA